MGRTRRAAIDGGFEQSGSDWYQSGSFVQFSAAGFVEFQLPFTAYFGGNGVYVDIVTLWQNGVLSLGPATEAQKAFFATGASPISGESGSGFPGEFFLFDHQPDTQYSSFSFGIGSADYEAPFLQSQSQPAAFFTFDNNYQIILDQDGFSIVSEPFGFGDGTNGYFIGSGQMEVTGQEISGGFDLFTYEGTTQPDFTSGTDFHDRFLSGAGADVIVGLAGYDLMSYRTSLSGVSVDLQTNVNSGGDAEGDQLFAIEDLEGSDTADFLRGDDAHNRLSGFGGDDTILGGGGIDDIQGGAGADRLSGGTGADTLRYTHSSAGVVVSLQDGSASGGDAEGDILDSFENLVGSFYADVLQASAVGSALFGANGDDALLGLAEVDRLGGGDGNDFLVGGGGADELDGGGGLDTASYANSAAAVSIDMDFGWPARASGGDAEGDRLTGIENIIGSVFADVVVGDFSDNRLSGGSGSDRLEGRGGNDVLMGDDGNDALKGGFGVDVLNGGAGDDALSGGDSSDIISGDAGTDLFDGGAGADTMIGGVGDDTFYVDNAGDSVIESAAEGASDRIFTSINYTLRTGVYVEELATSKPTGTAAINLTGNELANRLTGNAGANVLDGGAGADVMEGDLGNDTYIIDNALDIAREGSASGGTDAVRASVSFSLGKNLENLTLGGVGNINGSGNDLDNLIVGNGGANLLKGGAGNDTLVGGEGNDTLDGGVGADVLNGGTGDDRYLVDSSADVIVDAGGTDIVNASISFTLGSSIENLTLTGNSSTNGTGNSSDNIMIGNGGANTLKGGAGRDTLLGGDGNDTLNGGTGADIMDGGAGDDFYFVDDAADLILDTVGTDGVSSSVTYALGGSVENLTLAGKGDINGSGNSLDNLLVGNSGANTVKGGAGQDTLYGGLGADTLVGGAGADKFFFDSTLGNGNVDRISDFSAADDTIYLDQSIFGRLGLGGLANDSFRLGTAAQDADDRIIYDSATGNIWYDADGNGAGAAVHFATVTAGSTVTNADFFVVM